jgi:hypothetical protein
MEFLRNLAIFYEPTFPGSRVICEARIIPWGVLGNGKRSRAASGGANGGRFDALLSILRQQTARVR